MQTGLPGENDMLCYVRKVKNSQARTGHQRGVDGRDGGSQDLLRGERGEREQVRLAVGAQGGRHPWCTAAYRRAGRPAPRLARSSPAPRRCHRIIKRGVWHCVVSYPDSIAIGISKCTGQIS